MSSTIFTGDAASEAGCSVCGEPIALGVARYPTPDGFMHGSCSSIVAGPPGVLGSVETGDRVEVEVRRRWIPGTVEHASALESGEYVVRVALDDLVPMGVTDHVDVSTTYVCTEVSGPIWSEPEGFDIIPGWDTFDSAEEKALPAKHRSVGPVTVREPER